MTLMTKLRQLIEQPIQSGVEFLRRLVVAIGDLTADFRYPIDSNFTATGDLRRRIEPVNVAGKIEFIDRVGRRRLRRRSLFGGLWGLRPLGA